MGKEISAELREAIANCDVFLLIYTRRDVDWSWCMWEWGVASHPRSEKSTMIVLQCGSDAPKINAGKRQVDVRQREEVLEFVKQYLTDKQMFRHGKAVADRYSDDVIESKANALFENLLPLIRDIDPPIETSTWPYLQVEVPLETVQRIGNEEASLRPGCAGEIGERVSEGVGARRQGLEHIRSAAAGEHPPSETSEEAPITVGLLL